MKSESNHLDRNKKFPNFNQFTEKNNILQSNDYPSSSNNLASGLLSNQLISSLSNQKSFPSNQMCLENKDSFKNTQSDSAQVSNKTDKTTNEKLIIDKVNTSTDEEFKRCFKQLINEGFKSEQVIKALSISNNRIHLAKDILKQFESNE